MNDPRTNPEAEGGEAEPRLPAGLIAALRREESRWNLTVPTERDEQVLATCRAELEERMAGLGNRSSSAGSSHDGATGVSPFRDSPRPQPAAPSRVIPYPRVWLRRAAALAAALVVALGLGIALRSRFGNPAPEVNVAQPTILDAFALARALESSTPGGARHADLNGDGRVDQGDVDWLAQRAVELPAGGAL